MKAAKLTAWSWFSKYTRKRYALEEHPDLVKCFTCGKIIDWRYDCDASHFQSRRYESTLFDERNVQPCCKHCNKWLAGNIGVFFQQLQKTYGEDCPNQLIMKSQMLCKRNRNDYLEISKKYRQLYNEL